MAVHLRHETQPMSQYKPAAGKRLTPTEISIMLRVVQDGETLLEIAAALGRSTSTIATHLYRVRCKLGAKTTEQAAVFFDRAGRLPLSS